MSVDLPALDEDLELRGPLGHGGMGEVHRAWDRRLQRAVAVKLLRGQDVGDAGRVLLEARLQARVEHRHVVKVHGVGSLGGRPCIVFQLVEGRSLAQLAPRLGVAEKVELVRQAGLGLHAAHRQGLVHRDVKPANVLVEETADGHAAALLTDFGLARSEEAGLSRSGLPPGTLDYMSPEQLLAPGPVDFRSDVYALGATLYAVLAGRPPFRTTSFSAETPTDAADEVQVLRRILEEEPPPLTRAAPGIPRELGLIAARAMEKEPGRRYPSAEALSEDLARHQRGEPLLARPTPYLERALKWARRNRALARAVLVALLALVLAGGWTLYSRRRADRAALEAARLGALSEALEANLRMELLGPAHDVRPALERLRAQAEQLRPLAGGGDGPANLALGKALQLLGEVDGARQAYQAAWNAGQRTPRAAEGLGTVLGELYRRGYERARETLAPEARERRLATLRVELKEPAAQYLKQAEGAGWRAHELQSRVALLDRNYPEARKEALEAHTAEPGRYEALALAASAWIDEARDSTNANQFEKVEPALKEAKGLLEEASAWGRSDASIPRAVAQLHAVRANALTLRGQSPETEIGAMLSALDSADRLNADDATASALRGAALLQRAQYLFMTDPSAVLGVLEQATAAYRRAVELGAQDLKTFTSFARGLYYQAFQLNAGLQPSLDKVREGLAVAARAAALAPEDAEVDLIQCMLHSSEADALEHEGLSTKAARSASIEAGQRALAKQVARGGMLRPIIGQQLMLLGRDAWLSGGDPRPRFHEARQTFDEAFRALPGQPAAAGQFANVVDTESGILWALGEDPRPELERARSHLEDILQASPGLLFVQGIKAELLAEEALHVAEGGESPTALLAKADATFELAAHGTAGDFALTLGRVIARLAEARWRTSRDEEPSASLDRAERLIASLGPQEALALPQEMRARVALERARWLRHQQRATEVIAHRGLAALKVSLAQDARDADLWVLKARLEGFAGEADTARTSLEHAYSLNPLVKGGLASREAVAELQPR